MTLKPNPSACWLGSRWVWESSNRLKWFLESGWVCATNIPFHCFFALQSKKAKKVSIKKKDGSATMKNKRYIDTTSGWKKRGGAFLCAHAVAHVLKMEGRSSSSDVLDTIYEDMMVGLCFSISFTNFGKLFRSPFSYYMHYKVEWCKGLADFSELRVVQRKCGKEKLEKLDHYGERVPYCL